VSITVFLADDHAVVRDGLKALLEAQKDIQVVGEAATGEETLRRLKELSASVEVDVLVVDISMPEPNGIDVAREVRETYPGMGVVVLSMHATAEHLARALAAGAHAYVVKESAGAEVVNAVRAVHEGGRYLSGRISRELREPTRPEAGSSSGGGPASP
jgi:DNA-binding NarL/FixJ family response regulator